MVIAFHLALFSSYAQESGYVFKDTTMYFEGDVSFSMFQKEHGGQIFRIILNDTLVVFKHYAPNSKLAYKVYQTDANGSINGQYYFKDTISGSITYSTFSNGTVLKSVTMKGIDTIGYEHEINDTLKIHYKLQGDSIHKWQSDTSGKLSGYYKIYNKASGKLIESRFYKLIGEQDIIDNELFSREYKKLGNVRPRLTKDNKISIPYSEWVFYDSNGKVIKRIEYVWESVK